MRTLTHLLCLLTGLLLPTAPTHAQVTQQVAVVRLPFDLVGGLVVLRNLTVNDQRGDFILDTGCTYGLVVEQAAFAGKLRPSARSAMSAVGSQSISELPLTRFDFGPAQTLPRTAQATSLATLRARVGAKLLGLIGTDILRHYEVVIDYTHHRLSCYPLSGPPVARPFTRQDSVAFSLQKGWPVAVAFIGSVPVQLLLDTGAQENHLDTDFAQNLPADTRPTGAKRETIIALGGRQAAQRATLPALRVGTTEWRGVPLLLAPPAHYSSGRALPYQGILGATFLGQDGLVSFHYGRRQFYVLTPKRS